MSSNTSNVLFDDIFTINAIDKEGKKFDRGARSASVLHVAIPLTVTMAGLPMSSFPSVRALKKLRHGVDAGLQH